VISVTQFLTGLGLTTAAIIGAILAGLRVFGLKWLESHFSKRLEAIRYEGQTQLEDIKLIGQTQLERIRHENAGALDRVVKLNQREFEIVPEIWLKYTECHYAILRLISIWQESPDLSRMSEPQFEAFLEKSRLEEWQKAEIRAKGNFDRTSYYSDLARWHRLNDANEVVISLNRALLGNSIFLHPDTFSKFDESADAMRKAYNRFRTNMQMGDDFKLGEPDPADPANHYREHGENRYNELAKYLRERYWINAQGEAV
jgi:hypothetical protein